MELTTRGRYAVMAMADLARFSAGEPVALASIAERQMLSLAYLEQLFARLRRAGLVVSARGRSGGYKLGRPAGQIPIADILKAVEEETRMTRCSGEQGAGCVGEERCLTHGLWQALGQHITQFLGSVTLADVLENRGLLKPTVPEGRAERVAAE